MHDIAVLIRHHLQATAVQRQTRKNILICRCNQRVGSAHGINHPPLQQLKSGLFVTETSSRFNIHDTKELLAIKRFVQEKA